MTRPQYFMEIAKKTSELSTSKHKAGCILVQDKHIVGAGFNQVYIGYPDNRYIHAIIVALLACSHIDKIDYIYTTKTPCIDCTQLLLKTKATGIYYNKKWNNHKDVEKLWKSTNPKRFIKEIEL